MKCIVASFLITITLVIATQAAPPKTMDEKEKEAAWLIDQLPSRHFFWRCFYVVQQQRSDEQISLKLAETTFESIQKIVPKLRKVLKTHVSIFRYPALLAHGDISYKVINPADGVLDPAEWGYCLYLGIPVAKYAPADDFEILFDSTGMIRAINSQTWTR